MNTTQSELISIQNLVMHINVLNTLKEKIKKMSIPTTRRYSSKKIDIYVLDTEFADDDMEEEYIQAQQDGTKAIEEFANQNNYEMSLIKYLRLYNNGVVEINYEMDSDFDNDPRGFGVYFDTVEEFLNL